MAKSKMTKSKITSIIFLAVCSATFISIFGVWIWAQDFFIQGVDLIAAFYLIALDCPFVFMIFAVFLTAAIIKIVPDKKEQKLSLWIGLLVASAVSYIILIGFWIYLVIKEKQLIRILQFLDRAHYFGSTFGDRGYLSTIKINCPTSHIINIFLLTAIFVSAIVFIISHIRKCMKNGRLNENQIQQDKV